LHQLVVEELVVVLPESHVLAGRAAVRMADLAGEQFISYRSGARLRELLESAGHAAGFSPRVTLESNESGRIRRLVHRGLGVAILPRSDTERPGAEVAVSDLVEPSLTRDITLAWREGRQLGPAAAAFLELSMETFSPTDAAPA
jgi:DNA-binding transcriptional LysR family regulator